MPWFRIIKPDDEMRILAKRELSQDERLKPINRSRHPSDPYSTTVSAFSYHYPGIPQRYFKTTAGGRIGVLLHRKHREVLWRDSNKTVISDSVFKKCLPPKECIEKVKNLQFKIKDENDIYPLLRERYEKLRNSYIKEGHDLSNCMVPWTEGVFRYRSKEINGIVVEKGNKESYIKGIAFVVALNLQKKPYFCYYDSHSYQFVDISVQEIKDVVRESQRQINHLVQQYKTAAREAVRQRESAL